jgi:hypothetical protein
LNNPGFVPINLGEDAGCGVLLTADAAAAAIHGKKLKQT